MRASFKSAIIFQSSCEYVAVVPLFAKKRRNSFSLGGTEIILGKWAELGPLDPQVTSFQTERKYWRETETALEASRRSLCSKRGYTAIQRFIDFLIEIGFLEIKHSEQ